MCANEKCEICLQVYIYLLISLPIVNLGNVNLAKVGSTMVSLA